MLQFEINGDRGDRFSIDGPWDGEWRAFLHAKDVQAETRVWERYSGDHLGLTEYFGRLAEGWRGWQGTRELEHSCLTLCAIHDGRSGVDLQIHLWDNIAEPGWDVSYRMRLEAGEQLRDLARKARDFEGR